MRYGAVPPRIPTATSAHDTWEFTLAREAPSEEKPTGDNGHAARPLLRAEDIEYDNANALPRSLRTASPFGARHHRERVANARLGLIKRVGIGALKVLAAGGVLAAIVALQAAIYYWRFFH